MRVTTEMFIETRIVNAATGKFRKVRKPEKNLVLDQGLNAFAQKAGTPSPATPAGSFLQCHIGGGTNPVKTSSGAITFTQAGTTLTASGNFFTPGMVGTLFKWGVGSGGLEEYITVYTSATQVTVGTSTTVAVPDVGVIWGVNQSALQTPLFVSSTKQTNAGDCQTTYVNNVVTHKRTFIFPVQVAPYTVNEIAYSTFGGPTAIFGRIVLSSSDVVAPSDFYVVIMSMVVTWTPATPSAVGNVGTNIDTTGNAAIEQMAMQEVNPATGGLSSSGPLDGSATNINLLWAVGAYAQNANPSTSAFNFPAIVSMGASKAFTYVGGTIGLMQLDFNVSITTSGQTFTGFGFVLGAAVAFDIHLTTPFVAPTGNFQPHAIFYVQWGRTLVN